VSGHEGIDERIDEGIDEGIDAEDVAWLEARERAAWAREAGAQGRLGEPRASAPPPPAPERVATYQKLQQMIASLPDERTPRGWEAEVLASLSAMPLADDDGVAATRHDGMARHPAAAATQDVATQRRRWLARRAGVPIALAATALAVLLWRTGNGPGEKPAPALALSAEVVPRVGTRAARAAGEAALGDRLRVEQRDLGDGELRIYRDDREVVARCVAGTCRRSAAGRLELELELTAPGSYRAVWLQPAPRSAAQGALEADLAACQCTASTAVPVVAR
jgi:hypothetical protein